MSLRALPLQFLNLGGEMMYIIDQRLRAQTIPIDRADKVRNDILSIMLSRRFVEELFHPQQLYSKGALRTVFDKLAHASIMKLNSSSMDKLFDLMMMSLKHQVVIAPQPRDLLFITLNHIDAMAFFATVPSVQKQVFTVQKYLLQLYSNLIIGEWVDIRRDLLMFVQDLQVRVSIFLKTGVQDEFGRLIIPISGHVPKGSEVPGVIRFFDPSSESSLVTLFPTGVHYTVAKEEGSLEIIRDRGTELGLNVYEEKECNFTKINSIDEEQHIYEEIGTNSKSLREKESYAGQGREELNLLAHLIGATAQANDTKEFRLNLFLNDGDPSEDDKNSSDEILDVITIEGRNRENNPELGRIIGQLKLDESQTQPQDGAEDLLELLDSV